MNDQRSLTDQLRDAVRMCNEAEMYDAADWIKARLPSPAPDGDRWADVSAVWKEMEAAGEAIDVPELIERAIARRERRAAGGGVDDAAVAPGEGTGL